MRGGGELENLHVRFKREAVAAKKAAAEAALGPKKTAKAGGDSGKGKDGGGDRAGGAPGGAGGDPQQQDGGEQQAVVELDPEQQVGWAGLAASQGGMLGWEGSLKQAGLICAAVRSPRRVVSTLERMPPSAAAFSPQSSMPKVLEQRRMCRGS